MEKSFDSSPTEQVHAKSSQLPTIISYNNVSKEDLFAKSFGEFFHANLSNIKRGYLKFRILTIGTI